MAGTLKEQAQKFLPKVPEEYIFWCHDGRILHSMKELGDALNTMTDETYAFHANIEKNDFANWVRDVIKDERLAKDLQKASSQAQAAKLVASRMSILSKRLA
jgi:predicted metal-dependent HD superfamily phosphohydrolase